MQIYDAIPYDAIPIPLDFFLQWIVTLVSSNHCDKGGPKAAWVSLLQWVSV